MTADVVAPIYGHRYLGFFFKGNVEKLIREGINNKELLSIFNGR
jgi:hypothetical protein